MAGRNAELVCASKLGRLADAFEGIVSATNQFECAESVLGALRVMAVNCCV